MENDDHPQHRSWEQLVARFARSSGVVGEVDDPLTWGLDLEEETVTGSDHRDDPTAERFLRAYRTFAGEALEVETLHEPCPPELVDDVVRAACSGALAAPLHADLRSPVEQPGPGTGPDAPDAAGEVPDFAEDYADYRSAMRAIVEAVDEVPLEEGTFVVDGSLAPSTRVVVRDVVAVYVPVADRALVVTGPADLVDRVDVVTRPVRTLLHGEEEHGEEEHGEAEHGDAGRGRD
ncbi:hypothetical protein [Puerhibacterium puerhi]|uniref:hypothetical protein n=1 Tax=Puerhibacterium puerhi TaxID=2692623 RepID=UPI00135684DE|nr:hypothetical protein [Puerhibacterium puerhi]